MAKRNPLIRKNNKMTGFTTGAHKSAGILDDFALRKVLSAKEIIAQDVRISAGVDKTPLSIEKEGSGSSNYAGIKLKGTQAGGRIAIEFNDDNDDGIARIGAHDIDLLSAERHLHIKTPPLSGSGFKTRLTFGAGANVIQSTFFILGPLIYHSSNTPAYVVFWISVIIITITTIPFFSFLGLSLYFKINKMPSDRFKLLAKHILIMVLLCGSVGLFTVIAAIFSMFNTNFEVILIELCWASNIYLNFVIYLLLTRKKTSVINNTTTTSASSKDKKTSSTQTRTRTKSNYL